jgi:heme A synthase
MTNWTKSLSITNFIFALFIILWGAWVRLSGSGAGCGEHWPLCNGEVIPLSPSIQTIIEFTHRLTSGIFGITVLAMMFFAFKEFKKKNPVRLMSIATLVFTLIEALIGAVLVKKGLVENNDSSLRAIVIALHLVNTFLLMASIVATYFYSTSSARLKIDKKETLLFFAIVFLFFLTSSAGAIAALGNTLFPETSLIAGMAKDFDKSSHFLIRLRIFHPILAITLSVLLYATARRWSQLKINTKALEAIIFISVVFGFINWLMKAPVWGALMHLALANFLWAAFIYCFLKVTNTESFSS